MYSILNSTMNIYIVVLLVPLLYLQVTLLQNYFLYNNQHAEVNRSKPLFENLIVTDVTTTSDQRDISEQWGNADLDLLQKLHTALKSQLSKVNGSPKIIEKEGSQQYNLSESEIQNSVHAALAFKSSGKAEKALKIIEHAAAIAPNNPDILNYYGEILEITEKDVITADQLYFKVILGFIKLVE